MLWDADVYKGKEYFPLHHRARGWGGQEPTGDQPPLLAVSVNEETVRGAKSTHGNLLGEDISAHPSGPISNPVPSARPPSLQDTHYPAGPAVTLTTHLC